MAAVDDEHMVLYGRSATGNLLRKSFHAGTWAPVQRLGVPVACDPSGDRRSAVEWALGAVSQGSRCQLFGSSPDGALLWKPDAQAEDAEFVNLGAPAFPARNGPIPVGLAGPPAAVLDGERIKVFAIGQDGHLVVLEYTNGGWGAFDSLGVPEMHVAGTRPQPVPVFDRLSACTAGSDRTAIFLVSRSGALLFKWWDGRSWSDFASLGTPEGRDPLYPAVTAAAPLTGPPAACSWGAGRLDVFARGQNGGIVHRAWDGKEWGPFESLPQPVSGENGDGKPVCFLGSVTACSRVHGRVDVVASGVDGKLYHFAMARD